MPDRLRVEEMSVTVHGRRVVDAVTLDVRPGEIVGLAGLQGSGATELLLGLFGAMAPGTVTARVTLEDESVTIGGPRDAIARGMALLTNDRQASGLVLPLSVVANLTLPSLDRLSRFGWRHDQAEASLAGELMRSLAIRAASPALPVRNLSGGNQQKVALGRWLPLEPRLLLLDEPTRGVDVGAKREIYQLLDRLTAQGTAILVASSDLPELLALSDRVVVLHRGQVTARLARSEATPERVLAAAMGGEGAPAS
jgi:ABC-type sugar transport system ATPase subunit